MHSLPLFVRLKDRPFILLGEGESADAKRRLLERAGARICGEHDEAALAIVAIEEEESAIAAVGRLRARGILVNAVDRPALCDFTLPAIVDRDPLLIAIGSGGASAGLAKALRQRIEAMLPPSLGALAQGLYAARPAIRTRWPGSADRRRAIDAGLSEGGMIDPFTADAAERIDRWLSADRPPEASRLVPIRPRSGDPDDLTLGEARLLGQADRIFHRPDVPARLLDRARADAARIACAVLPDDLGPGLSIDMEMA